MNVDAGVSGDDDGAQGEEMGADGRDHHRVDRGHDDGAVGGEVVGGGAGRCGYDDAVGAEGGDELAIDLDGEVGHAGDGSLGDDDVVEGLPVLEGLCLRGGAGRASWRGFRCRRSYRTRLLGWRRGRRGGLR